MLWWESETWRWHGNRWLAVIVSSLMSDRLFTPYSGLHDDVDASGAEYLKVVVLFT